MGESQVIHKYCIIILGKEGLAALEEKQQKLLIQEIAIGRAKEKIKDKYKAVYESDLTKREDWNTVVKPELQAEYERVKGELNDSRGIR